jgi:two-component system, NarL family, sensor histidine kinase DesK
MEQEWVQQRTEKEPPGISREGRKGWLAAAQGFSPRLWRLFAILWLWFLVFAFVNLRSTHPAPASLLQVLVCVVIFVGIYVWLMVRHAFRVEQASRLSYRTPLLALVILLALLLFLRLTEGDYWLQLIIYISIAAGASLPLRFTGWFLAALVLFTISVGWEGGSGWLRLGSWVLLAVAPGLWMLGRARLFLTIEELREARAELARLAVAEERLRFARDLHDVLGHSLSVITLKSELAVRLSKKDPNRAAEEMHEIEQMAREALHQVREAVRGYRTPTLQHELVSAQYLLEAAGIACVIEQTAEELPEATDTALAWMVREGVTNVLKHSEAHWCTIRVARQTGKLQAEIINDTDRERGQVPTTSGSGLAGLAERVTVLGGHLSTGWLETEGRFRLAVSFPLDNWGTRAGARRR